MTFTDVVGVLVLLSPDDEAPAGGGGGDGSANGAEGAVEAKPKRRRRRRKPSGEGSESAEGRSGSGESSSGDGEGEGGGRKRRSRGGRSGGRSRGGRSEGGRRDDQQPLPQADDRPKVKKKAGSASKLQPGTPEWAEIFSEKSFADLGLRASVCKGAADYGYIWTTHIQAQLAPPIIAGKDVLGQARTGTGKTAAFGMPLFHQAQRQLPFQAIVLAPTRELAIQIADELEHLGKWTPIRVETVYGGDNIEKQAKRLEAGPDIIVATPGRLIDMVERGYMHLKNVRQIILDEVDRMLDIGFRDDIKRILGMIKSTKHQTIFVSATISEEIEKLAYSFMDEPEKVITTTGSLTVSLVDQYYMPVQPWDKRPLLIHMLKDEQPELAIIFCQMKRTVDKIAGRLRDAGLHAEAIHGDLMQSKRNRVMDRLRSGELHLLVASDLAARGIDVDNVSHVVNFDLPDDPEIYVHRIGRTARAGRTGRAFSLVTPEQGELLTEIEKQANAHLEELRYDDFEPGPVPQHVEQDKKDEEARIEAAKELSRYAPPKLPTEQGLEKEANRFPGGVVPTKLPPKMMRGKMRTSRTAKLEAAQAKARND